jgi:hypothetical protein
VLLQNKWRGGEAVGRTSLTVNKALAIMNKNRTDYKEKGLQGELALLAILQSYQDVRGGVILHSFTYPYASDRQSRNYAGNIYLDVSTGKYRDIRGNSGTQDEIDLLYITPFRIFVIEAKARSSRWKLYNHWVKQSGNILEKSPLAQTEKHARHLYHHLFEYIPEQAQEYIVPITVFVDKASVEDSRSPEFKNYIIAAIANNAKVKIQSNDTPLKYMLDVEAILAKLNNIGKGTIYR